MWGWKPAKRALEHLFAAGEVAIAGRQGFQRLYDLPERVLPPEVLAAPAPSPEEAGRRLVAQAAAALGVATEPDLRDYYRLGVVETKARLAELVEAGDLLAVEVEGWKRPAYLDPAARQPRRMRPAGPPGSRARARPGPCWRPPARRSRRPRRRPPRARRCTGPPRCRPPPPPAHRPSRATRRWRRHSRPRREGRRRARGSSRRTSRCGRVPYSRVRAGSPTSSLRCRSTRAAPVRTTARARGSPRPGAPRARSARRTRCRRGRRASRPRRRRGGRARGSTRPTTARSRCSAGPRRPRHTRLRRAPRNTACRQLRRTPAPGSRRRPAAPRTPGGTAPRCCYPPRVSASSAAK